MTSNEMINLASMEWGNIYHPMTSMKDKIWKKLSHIEERYEGDKLRLFWRIGLKWRGLGSIFAIGAEILLLNKGYGIAFLIKHQAVLENIMTLMRTYGRTGSFLRKIAKCIVRAQQPERVAQWLERYVESKKKVQYLHENDVPAWWGLRMWQLWKTSSRVDRASRWVFRDPSRIGRKAVTVFDRLHLNTQRIRMALTHKDNWRDWGFRIKYLPKSWEEVIPNEHVKPILHRNLKWVQAHGQLPKRKDIFWYVEPDISPADLQLVEETVPESKDTDQFLRLEGCSKIIQTLGKRGIGEISLMDGTYIPSSLGEDDATFLWKHRDQFLAACQFLETKPETIKRKIPSSLEEELSQWGYSKADISYAQTEWDNVRVPTADTFPTITETIRGYTMYKLSRLDPRQLTVGRYTDSSICLKYRDENYCWNAITDKNSARYVVEFDGNIVATSDVFRRGNTILFNRVDTTPEYRGICLLLLKAVGTRMLGCIGIEKVTFRKNSDLFWNSAHFWKPGHLWGTDNFWKTEHYAKVYNDDVITV